MSVVASTVLILFALLQVKHMLADYFLQTSRMLSGRATYLHLGRLQHACVHTAGSAAALLLIDAPLTFTALVALFDGIVHFHIDWAKARLVEDWDLYPSHAGFWRAMGCDQALHQMTYIGMAWAWLIVVAP